MKRVVSIVAALAAVIAIAGAIWWWFTPTWPTFPPAQSAQPQVIVQITRDYGYRTGDLIEIDLYIQHNANVEVNPAAVSLSGDFEVAGNQVTTTKMDDGTVVHRVRLTVQSFKVARQLSFQSSLTWKQGDTRQELVVPEKKLHTSLTWDGREELQEGDDPRISPYWYGSRHVVPLALSSLAFLALCVVALRNRFRPAAPKPAHEQQKRAARVLAQIKSGQGTQALHAELDALVRDRWQLGPIPVSQLSAEEVHEDLIEFLRLNCPAVYSQNKLDDAQRGRLCELGGWLVRDWTKYV